MLERDASRARRRSARANSRWKPIATLHSPIARWPRVEQRLGDDPDRVREVDDPGAGRAARRRPPRRCSSTTGTVRSAFANPPGAGRLLADGAEPAAAASRRTSRAAWPPTRSWMSTKSAPSRAASRSPVQRPAGPASRPARASGRRARRRSSSRSGSMSSRTSSSIGSTVGAAGEALDELRRVGAAAADDRDLEAHRASSSLPNRCGLDRLLITLSAIASHKPQQHARPSARGRRDAHGPLPVLELGPIPLHHQVYLDLRAALDAGRVAARRPPPARARARRALRLQPDHRPPRPRASSPASGRLERTRGRGTFVLPSAHRPRPRRRRCQLHRGDAAPRPRPGDPRRGGSEPAGEAASRTALGHRRSARRRSTSSASGWPTASRSSSSRSTCPAERFPGLLAADLEHGSLYDLLDRALRHAGSSAPARRSSRSLLPAREARLLGQSRAHRRRCSSRASPSTADGTARRVRAGRTSAATGRATTSSGSWSARARGPMDGRRTGAAATEAIADQSDGAPVNGPRPGGRSSPARRSTMRAIRAVRRAAAVLAVVVAACGGDATAPPAAPGRAAARRRPPAPRRDAGDHARPRRARSTIRWYCCLGAGDAPEQVTVEEQGRRGLQRQPTRTST